MPEIMSVDEAYKFLRISKPTLYRYVQRGEIPAFKVGRSWKFHKENLEKWINDSIEQTSAARKQAHT